MILETKIKGIRYEKKGDDQTFYILETDAGIMKGKAYFELQKDKCIKAEGSWVISKFNGKNEFYFKSVIPSLPIAPKSKFDYACSITKGIGEKLQAKIWEELVGDWEHIDIKTVDGVGDAIADEWKVTLAEIKNMGQQADLFAWMGQIGMTANMCAAAWTKWGKECGGVIYNNPYKLAELPHYGFLIVDKMVLNNETWQIGQTDQRRVVAAILYILDENANAGNTAMSFFKLEKEAQKLCIGITTHDVITGVINARKAKQASFVTGDEASVSGYLARAKDYEAEMAVWERWKNVK